MNKIGPLLEPIVENTTGANNMPWNSMEELTIVRTSDDWDRYYGGLIWDPLRKMCIVNTIYDRLYGLSVIWLNWMYTICLSMCLNRIFHRITIMSNSNDTYLLLFSSKFAKFASSDDVIRRPRSALAHHFPGRLRPHRTHTDGRSMCRRPTSDDFVA